MFLSYSIVLHEWHLHRSKLKIHIANIETDLVIVEHVSYSILKHTHTHTYTKQWIFWMMATYNYSFNRLYVHIYSSSIFHTDFHVRQHTHTALWEHKHPGSDLCVLTLIRHIVASCTMLHVCVRVKTHRHILIVLLILELFQGYNKACAATAWGHGVSLCFISVIIGVGCCSQWSE